MSESREDPDSSQDASVSRSEVVVPPYRPSERFWPYPDLEEQPSEEELLALDPELQSALFKVARRPFSITLEFPRFDGPGYERALDLARRSGEYLETGRGASLRHRARFFPVQAVKLRDLFEIVGRLDQCRVLVDDRAVPYARELWLPLFWFLIAR
jgi:hypothetical protein